MSRRYDLAILGGGTAGLVSALIAAGAGARVALIERDRTGGDCLWTGCVPSKSLIAAATLAHRMRHPASRRATAMTAGEAWARDELLALRIAEGLGVELETGSG